MVLKYPHYNKQQCHSYAVSDVLTLEDPYMIQDNRSCSILPNEDICGSIYHSSRKLCIFSLVGLNKAQLEN